MKRFFKAIAAPATVLCVVLALGLSMTRCTSVDDTLGQNFIPDHQNLKLRISTLNSVRTYLAQNDSVASNYTGKLFIGQMTDPVFGITAGSAMTDFFPATNVFNDKNYFGYKPVADSAILQLYVTGVHGNPEVPQTFNVYELRDSLKRDSVYYFNTPLQNVVDMSKPLFSFIMDTKKTDAVHEVKLISTTDGELFLKRIVETDSAIFASPIPKFHERFYGLYIAPAPGQPENAALYEITARTNSNTGLSSALIVYAHNIDRTNPTENKDTLAVYFRFSDSSPYPNMNVNRVVHTYPPAIADYIGNPPELATMTPLSTVYVQSLGGVVTYLDFSGMVDDLKALKPADRDIVVNQARIYFPINNRTAAALDAAPVRLGMYFTYGQTMVTPIPAYGPIPLTDYMYYQETNQGAVIPFNGYIYRSTGVYEMNITGYITRLIHDTENTPKEVWLGPEVNTRNSKYTQLELQGSTGLPGAARPIKLVVTYTLVKK